MRWQRWARLAVAVFLVGFSAVVYLAIRGRAPGSEAESPPERVDLAAASETAPGVLTFSNGETLGFEQALSYADGRVRLITVELKVPDEKGRVVTIRADQAVRREAGGSEIGHVDFTGHVDVTSTDDLHVTADEASYDAQSGMVSAPGAVRFERGRLSGTGIGASYDRARDRLWLLSDARVSFAADGAGAGALDVTAGGAGLARDEHQIHFERGVHIERDDRLIDALDAVVTLSEDESRVTLVELRGDSRITRRGDAPARPGDLSAMQSRDMTLGYADDGVTLQTATLVGGARLDLAGDGATGRRIAAQRLDIQLGPDGSTVTSLSGRDQVEVALPGGAGRPAQRVTAAVLDARGDAGGLRTARFTGGVEFRETPGAARGGAPAAERVARSSSLDLALEAGFGAVNAAEFAGGVAFTDGTWRGEGARARYAPAAGVLALSAETASGPPPRVADERLTIDARAIEITLATRALTAKGSVQTVIHARRRDAPADEKLPALLSEDAPVYVAAATLTYDGKATLATFGGGARLWQGETLVQGQTVTLDGAAGNLSASGSVRTVLTLVDPGKEGAPARTVTEAGQLEYDEAGRRITYDKAAHLNGPEGDVKAASIVMDLEETGRQLARAHASGGGTALLENKYHVTGSHLTYLASEGRYVVEGAPVRIVEERPTECVETVGTILTFTRSTATIDVDGTDGSRSKTTQVPCPGRRR